MSVSGNYPDNVSASDPEAIWNQTREPVQDDVCIREALGELAELELSLRYIDRHNPSDSYFKGYRGGANRCFDAYRVLEIIRRDLEELLGD